MAEGEVFFTTGPRGTPTHWKQTVFLLKEPLVVVEGKSSSLLSDSPYWTDENEM